MRLIIDTQGTSGLNESCRTCHSSYSIFYTWGLFPKGKHVIRYGHNPEQKHMQTKKTCMKTLVQTPNLYSAKEDIHTCCDEDIYSISYSSEYQFIFSSFLILISLQIKI